ncbi:hypothetical protein ACWD4J_22275 [Streptomyces sp. NPDC002577]
MSITFLLYLASVNTPVTAGTRSALVSSRDAHLTSDRPSTKENVCNRCAD